MSAATSARLPSLNARLIESGHRFPEDVLVSRPEPGPERVLQFGGGNFLRGFADWMLQRLNDHGLFAGRAVIVQSIDTATTLNAQDGLYTVVLRGLVNGKLAESRQIVSSVSRCLNLHADFAAFLRCAENPELRFVISNTTEAGIRKHPDDRLDSRPAPSFPGKLTQLLYARFRHFEGDRARGLVILPCELIEKNGETLERMVLELAAEWQLPQGFADWLAESCTFTNTLVDRIVSGYPKNEATKLTEELGYEDALLVAGEIYHSWVIESRRPLEHELPFTQAGLNVTWTRNITPYRERKVRILNGAHTMLAMAAYLAGKDTVRECMQDPALRAYVERGIQAEILPTLDLPPQELAAFAGAVLERFDNPFIQHYLLSISLNSVSKYKARILGTVIDYTRERGSFPPRLTFALAALIAFYRGRELEDGALIGSRKGVSYRIQDDASVLEFFSDAWSEDDRGSSLEFCTALVRRVLARADFWGEDLNLRLPGFDGVVAEQLHAIRSSGMRSALERLSEYSPQTLHSETPGE